MHSSYLHLVALAGALAATLIGSLRALRRAFERFVRDGEALEALLGSAALSSSLVAFEQLRRSPAWLAVVRAKGFVALAESPGFRLTMQQAGGRLDVVPISEANELGTPYLHAVWREATETGKMKAQPCRCRQNRI